MKNFKKSMLAMGVMSLSLAAHADMQPLEDQAMGTITGQAGVTIELETQVNIDKFIYTDEGSFEISDIYIGGANNLDMFPEIQNQPNNPIRDQSFPETSELLDNIRIDIDIASDGDVLIDFGPQNAVAPVDFAIRTGEMRLVGDTNSTLVADNLSVEGILLDIQLRVDTETDELSIDTAFAIDDLDVDVPMLAVGIRDMRVLGNTYLDNPSVVTAAARLNMTLYSDTNSQGNEALAVDIDDFRADVVIGDMLVGGASIGSITMDNLHIHSTQMRVYGH